MIEDNGDHMNPASAAYHPEPPPTAAELIEDERVRQVNEKGWTADCDDRRADGSLLRCAELITDDVLAERGDDSGDPWPEQRAGHVRNKYGKDHIRRLVIAGALIAAEIDRLIRAEMKNT